MKVTLTDIMESLNSDNMEDAQAALHEWFVEQSKQVHQKMTNPGAVEEGDVVDATDRFAARRAPQDIQPAEPNGDVANDAAGWMTIAKQIITTSRANLGHAEDDMAAEDIEEVIDCAKEALNLFNRGDVAGGVSALLPSANAQDYLPDFDSAYQSYLFHGAQAASESVVDEADDAFGAMQANQVQGTVQPAMPNGDPANDAAGWLYLAQKIAFSFHPDDGEDEMHSEDLEEIQDCANDAAASFREGDVATGVSALLPSANAQDYLINFDEIPEAYQQYLFHGATPAAESAVPTFEELVAELSESFKGLETVSDKLQNQEGAQVGEEGKVPVNTKATLPSHKGKDRVAGEPVEIKGKGHTGHALETSPKVTDVKLKGNVQNSKDDPSKVTAPKGALLNKMDGSVNTQSPISGKGAKGLKK